MKFFDVLHVKHETAHTRLLGWLLDPREDHGFGPAVLRRFCDQVAPEVTVADLRSATVSVEDRLPESRIDILIRTPRIWVYVENKVVHGALRLDQLHRHKIGAAGVYGKHERRVVVLSPLDPNTGEPQPWVGLNRRYTVLTWTESARCLKRALADVGKLRPAPAGRPFLEGYVDLIERRILRKWKTMNLQVLDNDSVRAAARYVTQRESFHAQFRDYLTAVQRELGKLDKQIRVTAPTRPSVEDGEVTLEAAKWLIQRRGSTKVEVWLHFFCSADAKTIKDVNLWLSVDSADPAVCSVMRRKRLLTSAGCRTRCGPSAVLYDHSNDPDAWVSIGEVIPRIYWLNPRNPDHAVAHTAQRLRRYLNVAADIAG